MSVLEANARILRDNEPMMETLQAANDTEHCWVDVMQPEGAGPLAGWYQLQSITDVGGGEWSLIAFAPPMAGYSRFYCLPLRAGRDQSFCSPMRQRGSNYVSSVAKVWRPSLV